MGDDVRKCREHPNTFQAPRNLEKITQSSILSQRAIKISSSENLYVLILQIAMEILCKRMYVLRVGISINDLKTKYTNMYFSGENE